MFAVRRVLTALLIAFLASGTLFIPALHHRHAMSDHSNPQDKPARHSHSHAHQHSHHHDELAPQHGTEAEPPFGDPPIDHLHVLWFGFELTLPVSRDDSSDREESVGEWVSLLGESIRSQVVVASDVQDLDSLDVGTEALPAMMPPRAESSAPQTISLLCGTARRERTGVLNI